MKKLKLFERGLKLYHFLTLNDKIQCYEIYFNKYIL